MYATGHYTATKVAYLHGLYPLRLFFHYRFCTLLFFLLPTSWDIEKIEE